MIVAIDGRPVNHVSGLLDLWSKNKRDSVTLSVRRYGADRQITMPATDFNALIHPHP